MTFHDKKEKKIEPRNIFIKLLMEDLFSIFAFAYYYFANSDHPKSNQFFMFEAKKKGMLQ